MAKKSIYFSHDSNARNDDKMIAVRMRHGAEGYGIYFMILERLRESSDYMSVKDYNVIAFDLRVSSEKIKSVIEDFGLFVFTDDGKHFYSESLRNRMTIMEGRSESAKKAAEARWKKSPDKQGVNADTMRTHSKSNADAMQIKEINKIKEKKESVMSRAQVRTPAHEDPVPKKDKPKAHQWQSYPIDELVSELNSSATWKESVAMQYGLKLDDVGNWIAKFAGHLKASGEESKTLRDAKKHFSSWLRIQLEAQKKQNPTSSHLPADNSWRTDKTQHPPIPGDWRWSEVSTRWMNRENMNLTDQKKFGVYR